MTTYTPKRVLRFALLAALLLSFPAACSVYHGPITNAPAGYHEIGLPTGS